MNAALVLPSESHESYWQPGPSHGWMSTVLTPRNCASNVMAAAIQLLDPGCKIRPHAHANMDEILFILEGRGALLLDDVPYPVEPGSCTWLGRYVKHELLNEGEGPMRLLAVLLPPGTEFAWRHMGRPRRPGDPAPAPYGREAFTDLQPVLDNAGFARPEAIAAPPPGAKGVGLVMAPQDGESYWQPRPTGGYMTVKFSRANTPSNLTAMGVQVVPPGGVRPDRRAMQAEEMLFVAGGRGSVRLDGVVHTLAEDTLVYVPRGVAVGFENTGDQDLTLVWVKSPPSPQSLAGLLGRPRRAGEPAPPAFDPPADGADRALSQGVELAAAY